MNTSKPLSQAAFAAGCFWGVEEAFRVLPGVLKTSVGYCGGHTNNPTYKEVCRGDTGHAEVVMVEFDPDQISYDALLSVFWQRHNPTTKNRQGPDVGSQYRSAIFYHDDAQKQQAKNSKNNLPNAGDVVTEIVPFEKYYLAEDYHQQYIFKKK